MVWETPLIKFGLDQLIKLLETLRKKGEVEKQREIASTVISELLKLDPDITKAQAKLLALEATGATPTPELLKAKEFLENVKNTARASKRIARSTTRRKTKQKSTKRKAKTTKRKTSKRKIKAKTIKRKTTKRKTVKSKTGKL